MTLTSDDFPRFFDAVHGVAPFPWQARLLAQVSVAGAWPKVLDLPTGSGKTAALDVAVFHLAMEAEKGPERQAPVRIAFVVDRRIIVDAAFERAEQIARALAAAKGVVVTEVARRLGALAERAEAPLLARRLRGGMPREDDWARTPSQPTILCSTVDQVGSRLLFRGYGVSDSMKPVHAGLLGSDCLILLDEAHLARPFRQTVDAIEAHRKRWRAAAFPASPFAVAQLTATPDAGDAERFTLSAADRDHPILRRRLQAEKPAVLMPVKARADGEDARTIEIQRQVRIAFAHLAGEEVGAQPAIGIVVNRVLRARAVFNALHVAYSGASGAEAAADVLLLIGPSREADRERVTASLGHIKTGATRRRDRPLIVVATQTIEAGADLDFDALITELAPLDALKQRFGRLNRDGRSFIPYAAILAHREDERPGKNGDPVYGQAAANTWRALQAHAGDAAKIDFGLSPNQAPWIGDIKGEGLMAPTEDAPVVMPAYVDLWSQTSPVPAADPEPALFLHGPNRSAATVQIVWRDDLELNRTDADSTLLLTQMPPRAAETAQVPLAAARRWLEGSSEVASSRSREFSDAPEADIDEPSPREQSRVVLRWAGPTSDRTARTSASGLRPNDLLVAPAAYGGCDAFGWNPAADAPVEDVADWAARPYRAKRFALRLTPRRIEAMADQNEAGPDRAKDYSALFTRTLKAIEEPSQGVRARALIGELLALTNADAVVKPPAQIRTALEELSRANDPRLFFPYGWDEDGHPRGIVIVARQGLDLRSEDARAGGDPSTEDDDAGSLAGYAQPLDEHSREVRDLAAEFARKCGLPPSVCGDVALAAYLHDAGKADPRFQAWLYGGNWLTVDDACVLAKSGATLPRSARERAGLPHAWRHEALSVSIARSHERFIADASDPELVLWLVGVHHGYGRPFFPHVDEAPPPRLAPALGELRAVGAGPQSLAFEFDGWDWPQLFERLKARYGVWELARLEAAVRLADHRASEAAGRRPGESARQ
ncbi:MAG TPA: type I-U CRISPR-associated helicase/endonuclease Cas3 [Caulobacteraceae bacterium]|nr:type I-U CRISPR-associated helicase/endonuclease Cas3 [Caulobacteraceae bacterium]